MNNPPKILLILPPANLFPLGAACVATTLKNAGYAYDIYGFFYDNRAWFKRTRAGADNTTVQEPVRNIPSLLSHDSLFELIAHENYSHILVGGLVGFFRWFYQILPQLKAYSPQSKLIIGGGITKDLPENTLFEHLHADYLLKGEAETNLIQLLTLLSQTDSNPRDYFAVPGLCWKDSTSAIKRNATVRFDISQNIVRPAWDSFPIDEYIALSDTLYHFNKTFFPILAGRGCPNVCAFCSPSIGHFSPCPVDAVISEMQYWAATYAFDFFFIYSEVAFNDEAYTQEFCHKYRTTLNKPWVGQIRTDVHFSVDTYRHMKDAGCMFLGMGFESSNDRVLRIMHKHATSTDHLRNLTHARQAGLPVVGNFMFGHETETAEEIKETFSFLNKYDLINGPANGLATIIVYPGTQYYRNAEKRGLVADPLKYLLSYSMKAAMSAATFRTRNNTSWLNISALSEDAFYDVLCAEYIAHRRIYSQRHAAIDIECDFALDSTPGHIFRGICPTCGRRVQFSPTSVQNPLNITTLCHGCYYTTSVDILTLPETADYLKGLRESLAAFDKIVVYGSWLMDLLFCGSLSIPCDKLFAWVDPANPHVSQYSHFYHLPQPSSAVLAAGNYDAILCLTPRAQATPQILKEHGLNRHRPIFNLSPDIFNAPISAALSQKRVAIAGTSDSARKVHDLLCADKCAGEILTFPHITNIRAAEATYDYLLYDHDEFPITRQALAQHSQYHLHNILYTTFALDGGYYATD